MSPEEQDARYRLEAELVAFRAAQLYADPIQGLFDVEHLKAVHAHLFQDLREHLPGVMRRDTPAWLKTRHLEGQGPSHVVHYLHENVEAWIGHVLETFGGPEEIRGLGRDEAAERLARLYGDLDHAHGFHEGNSRTLREFTRELAAEAGFVLDWRQTDFSSEQRNALYVARDVAVLERLYPDLAEERLNSVMDVDEAEAWLRLHQLRTLQGSNTLETIIRNGLRPVDEIQPSLAERMWENLSRLAEQAEPHPADLPERLIAAARASAEHNDELASRPVEVLVHRLKL